MTSPVPSDPSSSPRTSPPSYPRGELTRQLMRVQNPFGAAAPVPNEATLAKASNSGAQWFYWIAGVSLVTSCIAFSGGHTAFLMGLTVSQIINVLARHLGSFGPYFGLGLNLIIASFFCGFGYLASHGSRAAYLVGMILYVLDTLLCLYLGMYLPAAMHVFVLLMMLIGYNSQRELVRTRDGSTPPKLTAT